MCIYSFKHRWFSLFCYVCVIFIYNPVIVNAANDDSALYESEAGFFSEIPNVISATRIRQPLTEAPSSVTVIDRAMIEASGAIELGDVLRLVPGVQVSYPQGNQIAVTYHGFSDSFPRKLQMVVDGRAIYQSSFADVDWLFVGVALEDVDRIEVVRGPNSPLYGANSVQGVINIITRQPYQDAGTHIGVTGGSLDTRNGIIRHSGNTGSLDYRVTATYEEASGLPGDMDSTNDGREITGLSVRGVWQKGPNDEIDIQLGVEGGRLGAGAEPSEDPPAHDKEVQANYQSINWRHAYNDGGDSHLHLYHNAYSSNDEFRDLLSHAFNVTPETIEYLLEGIPDQEAELGIYHYKGNRYDLEWQYTSPRKGNWRSIIGVGARLDQIKSEKLTNRDEWINQSSSRVFTNVEYRPTSSLITGLGLMAENTNEFGSHISPRLSVNYLYTDQHSLRASYTRVKRNPSLFEDNFKFMLKLDDGTEFFESRRSNEIEPETVTSAEIGFIGYWLDRKLYLDIKAFREQTEDAMHELEDPTLLQPFPNIPKPIFVYDNDGIFKTVGAEMQLKYQVSPQDFISFQYAHIDADSTLTRYVGSNELWEVPEPSVPKQTISMLASHRFPGGFDASIAYYSLSEIWWLGDGDPLDTYHRWDFRLAKSWKVDSKRLKAEFIVHNIGNDYFTFRDENLFETRYFLRLSVGM
ncbi:TonB-dependent receptor plug domain-containing protein [Pseudomonadota bacterium]